MNSDVLEMARFTDISFVSKRFQGTIAPTGDSTIQIAGVFTLHGTPHDLTVHLQLHIDGTNLTAKTHFTAPNVKCGLTSPGTFILKVSKDVDIDLPLEGR